jgi:hypothetical protein
MDTSGQFHKTFLEHNLRSYRHIAISFDLGYAAGGVNHSEKSFVKLKGKLVKAKKI